MQAQHPYSEYTLYIVTHKGEGGRKMANLVSKEHRTTISYARYLMSVKLGRKLLKEEHVDHIDGNKLNDADDNLQILSMAENRAKYNQLDNPTKLVDLVCTQCDTAFQRTKQKAYPITHKGGKPFCSKECANANLVGTGVPKVDVEAIRRLRSEGGSSYTIAFALGLSRNTVMKYWK